jgi:hypothetical protein
MNEFNPGQHRIERASALELVNEVVRLAGAIEFHAAYSNSKWRAEIGAIGCREGRSERNRRDDPGRGARSSGGELG